MKHLKLFEEIEIDREDFPWDGHELSPRESKILIDLVGGDDYYMNLFDIKVEDHYYYTLYYAYYNRFDNFIELKDYILYWYFIELDEPEKYLELLKTSKLDPSFDDNWPIWWAYENGHREIIRFLLNDERVRDKLTEEEINRFTNEIS